MANEVIDFTEENAPSPDIDFQEEPLKETALRTAIEAPGAVNRLITRQIEGGALATPDKIVPPKPQEFMAGAGPTAGLPLAAPPAARSAIQTLTQPGRDFIQAVEDIGAEGMRNLGIDPSAQAGQPMINIPRIPTGLGMISEGLRRANVIPPNPVSNVLEGIERTAGETVTGFTSPGMAVGAPFLGEGKVAQSVFGMGARAASKAAAILFASEQFESLPDQVKESLRVLRDPNAGTADKTAALLRPGVATVIGVTMAKHGIAREPGLPPGEGYFKGEMPPLEFTGAELPGRPAGFVPIRPTAGTEVLGPEAPARFRRPEVPVTAPEPMRDLSMAEEERIGRQLQIEQVQKAGARTKEAVQKLFPAMNRQQAAALRDAAWPKAPEVAPPIQRRGLSLEQATEIANKEGGTILERGRGNFEVVPPEEPPPAAPAAEPVTKPPGPAPVAPEPAAKELPGIEEARGAETESGWTLKTGQKAAGITIPDDLSGYSPEDQAKLKKLMAAQPRVYEFTDTREDSPTRGATIYVPEGTPKAEILKRINEFAEQDRAKKAVAAPAAPPTAPAAPEIEWMGKPLSFWEALANDLPKGDERARLARSLGVPNQPSKITQHIKRRIEEIRRNAAAPKPEPTVTLYSGSGGAEGAGQGGQWFTAKAEKARTFGPNVQAVEVPKSVADAAKAAAEKSGQGGDTYFLEKKWSDKASPVEAPPEVVHEIPEEPTAPEVKPTPAEPAAPGELLAVPPTIPTMEQQRTQIVSLLEQLEDVDQLGRVTDKEEIPLDQFNKIALQAANILGKPWGELLQLDQPQLRKAIRDYLGKIESFKMGKGKPVWPTPPPRQQPTASLALLEAEFNREKSPGELLSAAEDLIDQNPEELPEGLKKAALDYRAWLEDNEGTTGKEGDRFMSELRKALGAKEPPTETKPAEPATETVEPVTIPEKYNYAKDTSLEAKLWGAAHGYEKASERWAKLRGKGATDEELLQMLGREFGIQGGSSGYGGYGYKGGKNPRLWAQGLTWGGKPDLSGKALIAMARKVLEIPEPKGTKIETPAAAPAKPAEPEQYGLDYLLFKLSGKTPSFRGTLSEDGKTWTSPKITKAQANELINLADKAGWITTGYNEPTPGKGRKVDFERKPTAEEAEILQKKARISRLQYIAENQPDSAEAAKAEIKRVQAEIDAAEKGEAPSKLGDEVTAGDIDRLALMYGMTIEQWKDQPSYERNRQFAWYRSVMPDVERLEKAVAEKDIHMVRALWTHDRGEGKPIRTMFKALTKEKDPETWVTTFEARKGGGEVAKERRPAATEGEGQWFKAPNGDWQLYSGDRDFVVWQNNQGHWLASETGTLVEGGAKWMESATTEAEAKALVEARLKESAAPAAKPVTSVPRASLTFEENPSMEAKSQALTEAARKEMDLEGQYQELVKKRDALEPGSKAAVAINQQIVDNLAQTKELHSEVSRLHGEVFDYRRSKELAKFAGQPEAPTSPPTITPKVLKAQREDLLAQVDEAIKAAPAEGTDKILISVEGDGEWNLVNNKEKLKKFRDLAAEQFPTTIAEPQKLGGLEKGVAASTTKSGKPTPMPKASEPKPADVPKVAARSVSEEPTRGPIQTAYSDGTQIIATDGRQLLRVVTNDAPGEPSEPVRLNSSGQVDRDVTSNYPNFAQVIPTDPTLVMGGMKTADLWQIANQAKKFGDSYGEQKTQPVLQLFLNADRSVGGRVVFMGDSFEHNVQPGAKNIGGYNPDYVLNAADTARRLGNETVDVYAEGDSGPIEFVGKNHQHLVMPLKMEGRTPTDPVRDNPNTIPADFAGKKDHTRPERGYGVLRNPEAFNFRQVTTGSGNFQVSYEGGKLKVERSVKATSKYDTDRMVTVAEFDRGDQNATDIAQGIVKSTGKEVSKGTTKTILDAMTSLEKERGEIIAEGAKRAKGRPKLPPGISMGPGAASPAEFEQGMPSSQALGIDTGNPLLNRIRARVANFGQGLTQLFARTENKKDIASLVNAARNLPRFIGQTAGNTLRLRADKPERHAVTFIMQALKMSGDGLTPEAMERIGPLEFQGDPIGYLRTKQADLETAAQAFLQKGQRLEAEAAANAARSMALAQKNYNQLLPVARKARSQFDAQFKREQVAGIDTDYERWYVPQRHELDLFASPDRPIILGENRAGGGTTFRKAKVYEDYASAIEDGFVPKSTDIADLLENRVYQGEAMIQRRELFNKLKLFKDPVDGKPMVTKVPRRVITRENGEIDVQESVPRGYQKFQVMPGVNVAVHDGYARLLRALTATSQISESAVVGTLQDIAAIEKHIGLALDTFHASRTLQAELALTGKLSIGEHQKRGLALVEYKPSDLDLAAQKGLITQEMADWVRRPTEMEVGGKKVKLSPHALIVLGAKNGLNMARIADVMYRDWLREVPITGDVNKWVFDKMTRSAISQSFLVEFERAAKANPHLKAEPVARMVARDINTFFGNLQAESIFKNPSLNAINQILFLAPRWVEALATREARFVKQAGQAGKDIIFGRKLGLPEIQKTETGTTTLQRYTHVPYVGTIGKGVGTGLAAYLIGTQLLNLFTRHQLTFQNKEEGHRLDAWIPPLPGTAGPGFFISPLSVFGEITHDILRLAETKPDLASAISQIGQNKLGNLGRFFEVVASGRDPLTNEKIIGTGRRAISAAAQIIPIPIAMSQIARAGIAKGAPELFTPPPPGSVQRQLTASMGFKTEPVPSAQQQVYRMADAWKRSSRDPRLQRDVERRLKEDFGPSDYRQLRGALIGGNLEDAAQAYDALIRDGKSSKQIRETMGHPHPFTGSARHERDFKHVLTPEQRKTYEAAIKERQDLYRRFEQMLREKHQRKE